MCAYRLSEVPSSSPFYHSTLPQYDYDDGASKIIRIYHSNVPRLEYVQRHQPAKVVALARKSWKQRKRKAEQNMVYQQQSPHKILVRALLFL
jgi:hypothetical protein